MFGLSLQYATLFWKISVLGVNGGDTRLVAHTMVEDRLGGVPPQQRSNI
jgi:hypothetical protein